MSGVTQTDRWHVTELGALLYGDDSGGITVAGLAVWQDSPERTEAIRALSRWCQEAAQLRPLVKLHQGAHVASVEAFIGMGDAVMTTIADGGSLSDVLDVVGDWLSGRDAIDEESEALFDRAKTAAGSPLPTSAPTVPPGTHVVVIRGATT